VAAPAILGRGDEQRFAGGHDRVDRADPDTHQRCVQPGADSSAVL